MKKIALTLAAVAALGVAACDPANNEANTLDNAVDIDATGNEADIDVNGAAGEAAAVNAADAALDSAGNAVDAAGDTIANAADDVADAADNATN